MARFLYSPHYESTNNLIKWQFRLKRMVCLAWAQLRMHTIKLSLARYLRMEALISTIVGLLILRM